MAKLSSGKIFEGEFKASLKDSCRFYFYRFRDGTSSWGGGEKTRFQAKNICDCLVFDNIGGVLYFVELKSYKGKSVPFSCLRRNQIVELSEAARGARTVSLVIFNMRDVQKTYAVEIDSVVRYMADSERNSFPLSFFEEDGFLISQELKRERYKYGLEELFDGMTELVLDK